MDRGIPKEKRAIFFDNFVKTHLARGGRTPRADDDSKSDRNTRAPTAAATDGVASGMRGGGVTVSSQWRVWQPRVA